MTHTTLTDATTSRSFSPISTPLLDPWVALRKLPRAHTGSWANVPTRYWIDLFARQDLLFVRLRIRSIILVIVLHVLKWWNTYAQTVVNDSLYLYPHAGPYTVFSHNIAINHVQTGISVCHCHQIKVEAIVCQGVSMIRKMRCANHFSSAPSLHYYFWLQGGAMHTVHVLRLKCTVFFASSKFLWENLIHADVSRCNFTSCSAKPVPVLVMSLPQD